MASPSHLPSRLAQLAVLLLLGVGLLGCEADPAFGPCDFDPGIEATCAPGAESRLSCVVRDHPDCKDRVCMTWKGSTAFCTEACSATSGCADGGICTPFLDEFFCVAPQLVE